MLPYSVLCILFGVYLEFYHADNCRFTSSWSRITKIQFDIKNISIHIQRYCAGMPENQRTISNDDNNAVLCVPGFPQVVQRIRRGIQIRLSAIFFFPCTFTSSLLALASITKAFPCCCSTIHGAISLLGGNKVIY